MSHLCIFCLVDAWERLSGGRSPRNLELWQNSNTKNVAEEADTAKGPQHRGRKQPGKWGTFKPWGKKRHRRAVHNAERDQRVFFFLV